MEQQRFDIIVVGGGLVGCCLAYALKDLPLRIGIIEARSPDTINANTDRRAIALTYGSQRYLEKLGLWIGLASAAMPIQQVHVSDRGHFGMTRFNAQDMHIPALGYVIPFNTLQRHFLQRLHEVSTIELLAPAQVSTLEKLDKQWQITLQTPTGVQTILTTLILAADGGNSTIRRLQNIPVTEWDYQQTAIIAQIELKRSHQQIAYERFTPNGAIALLPYSVQQAALIWTVKNSQLAELLSLADTPFLRHLQQEFGYRAGCFNAISKRQSYPLKMLYAEPQANSDLILLGNAAHTLHPIAAQGFNLGLRDVAVLTPLLQKHIQQQPSLVSQQLNQAFLQERYRDHQSMIYFTDSLTRIFTNDFFPLVWTRNLGLIGLECLPGLKRRFVTKALGIIR